MFVRILHWLGILACLALIVSCFLPWGYYADPQIAKEADRVFTGFYSYKQYYGKPGIIFSFFAVLILVFMLIPKVWAKRTNLFLSGFMLAYAVRTFIVFGSCYNNYCPQKLVGLYLMLACNIMMMLASAFPNVNLTDKKTASLG
ncbi:MAG: hypothetical protein ACKOU7_11495 [Ferruginibacter sp.]